MLDRFTAQSDTPGTHDDCDHVAGHCVLEPKLTRDPYSDPDRYWRR